MTTDRTATGQPDLLARKLRLACYADALTKSTGFEFGDEVVEAVVAVADKELAMLRAVVEIEVSTALDHRDVVAVFGRRKCTVCGVDHLKTISKAIGCELP